VKDVDDRRPLRGGHGPVDLGNEVSAVISDVLDELSRFHRALPESEADRLAVRVFDSLPPARLYRWDNRAISSFFPMGTGLATGSATTRPSAAR
jgi:hypothetical protein